MDQSEDSFHIASQSETSLFTAKEEDSGTDEEERETYYFESDHVALKGNPDYHAMLRTIALLEAQRIQVRQSYTNRDCTNRDLHKHRLHKHRLHKQIAQT